MQVVDSNGFLKVRLSGASDGITIGTTAITSGTVGRVLFEGTGNVVQESANLFWDNTNSRLGIGTASPTARFQVSHPTTGATILGRFIHAFQGNYVDITGGDLYAGSIAGYQNASTKRWELTNAGDLILSHPSSVPTISGGGQLRLSGTNTVAVTSGNFLINTTTDAGFRLDVNGSTRINGDITAIRVVSSILRDGNNNAYINNSLINIATTNLAIGGTTVQDFTFTTKTSGGKYVFNNANVLINTTTDAGFKLDVNGTARVTDLTIGTPSVDNNIRFGGNNTRIFNSIADNSLNYQSVFSASTVFRFTTNSSLPNANTSGTNVFMSLPIGFAPTSGTGTWSQLSLTPTINQTGGASGITRGLYVNPTLTAAADFRAIETTAGRVIFGGLPTSSAGLPTGAIWNDAGTLKIV